MVLGIAVASWAGTAAGKRSRFPQANYATALALAILCGLIAPMLNYAFAFGEGIANQAVAHGNSSEAAGYAVWPIALLGGLIPNVWLRRLAALAQPDVVRFPFRLAIRRLVRYRHGRTVDGSLCRLWSQLGLSRPLGTSAGWALFQIFMIMTANCAGLLTAEWRGAPSAAKWGMAAGLILLSAATALIAPRS